MILDGWGKGDHGHDDVVYSADPVYINGLEAKYPSAKTSAFPTDRWVIRK